MTKSSPTDEEREFEQAFAQFRKLLKREEIDALQPLGPAAVYTTMMTVWLLVYQRLHAGCSLTQAVQEFVQSDPACLPSNRRVCEGTLSTNTAAYSRARTRLKVKVTDVVAQRVFDSLVAATPPSLGDRRVFLLDGTTITLAPTPALKAAFPPARNQHGASVWPVAQGHDVVLRLTEARFTALRRRATCASRDRLERRWELTWTPSPRERTLHPELAADAGVRVWLHEVVVSETLTLWFVTTWDCDSDVPANLYRRRVDVETDIRDVKVTLKTEWMHARTPLMLRKELATSMIAY